MPKRPPLEVTEVAPKAEPAGLKADETPKLKNVKGSWLFYLILQYTVGICPIVDWSLIQMVV